MTANPGGQTLIALCGFSERFGELLNETNYSASLRRQQFLMNGVWGGRSHRAQRASGLTGSRAVPWPSSAGPRR